MTPLAMLCELYVYIDDDILTDWEAEFVNDLVDAQELYGTAFTFTPKQKEKLEQIYNERVRNHTE